MTIKQIHIEKYDFDAFEKEQKPYTMILTEVVQKLPMNRAHEFLLWTYLESLPSTWKPNKAHLTKHFTISDRTYERYMSWLNAVGLIEYRQNREESGTFGKGMLVVLNGSKFNPSAVSSRSAKIGGTVVNRLKSAQIVQLNRTAKLPLNGEAVERLNDAHINTINTFSKTELKEETTTHCEPPEKPTPSSSSFFSEKQKEELLSYKLSMDTRSDDLFLQNCDFHASQQKNDNSKYQRFVGLKNILIKAWENKEPFKATGFNKKIEKEEQRTTPPTLGDIENYKNCVSGYEWVGAFRRQA